jgi:hypothetical protein
MMRETTTSKRTRRVIAPFQQARDVEEGAQVALITKFEERPLDPKSIHKPVDCGFRAVDIEGVRILQLETYGSAQRQMPEKVSQSIQLDLKAARRLKQILESSFPGI